MSRIGKIPIPVPPAVKVEIKDRTVFVEGPRGKLDFELPKKTSIALNGDNLVVSRQGDDAQSKALHGLSRAIVNNMVKGVTDGFMKKLEIQGWVSKRQSRENVNMVLGYSHPILYPIPDQIKVTVEENTKLTIEVRAKKSLAGWRRSCVASIRLNLTKARAFVTQEKRFSARKARPFNSASETHIAGCG